MHNSIKVGIMGGTFDPIHYAHIELAKKSYEQYALDKVIFIPSGVSYLKKDRNVSDALHRLEMTKLAIREYPYFEVSTIEIDRAGNSYTFETLEELKKIHPEYELYFILGADSLLYMDKWLEPERIFSNCTIICAVRDNSNIDIIQNKADWLKDNMGAKVLILNMPPIDISSTKIRDLVLQNKDITSFVPEAVKEYILQEHLYEIN